VKFKYDDLRRTFNLFVFPFDRKTRMQPIILQKKESQEEVWGPDLASALHLGGCQCRAAALGQEKKEAHNEHTNASKNSK